MRPLFFVFLFKIYPMINSVRNTVMFLLNKDNRGYLAPSEYDYFAKQAQLEIFEGYFQDYARSIEAQNKRKKALDYGDSAMHIANKIDVFTKSAQLTYVDVAPLNTVGDNDYLSMPSDFYKIINVVTGGKVVEEVAKYKFDMLVGSNLTAPSTAFPIYKREGDKLYVRPSSLLENVVTMNYIKKPSDPHWGYTTVGGDPVYNADSSTDFELPAADETELVIKICSYAGLNIRERDVIAVAQEMDRADFQKENI
jgi:hypothetical protein